MSDKKLTKEEIEAKDFVMREMAELHRYLDVTDPFLIEDLEMMEEKDVKLRLSEAIKSLEYIPDTNKERIKNTNQRIQVITRYLRLKELQKENPDINGNSWIVG